MSAAPQPPLAVSADDDDFISLAPLWSLIRRYRFWLELSFFALLVLGAGLAAAAYVFFPKKVRTGVEFALTFPDAALGFYPSKLAFRPEDLLETSLLRQVYSQNDLARFMGFDTFRAGLSLERSGSDLELLQREFRARLDDRKLTLADRERIEAQYQTQLKAIPATVYRLNFVQTGRPARLLPPARRTKVLEDILRSWSSDAVFQKKVLVLAARLPGEMPLPEGGRDPLVALMELMERTRTLGTGLSEMARLPGGDQVALPDGARLVDLQLRQDALQELRIPQIRSALLGNIADPAQAAMIERVFRLQVRIREDRLRLAQELLRGQIATYRDYLSSRPETPASAARPAAEGGAAAGGTQLQISDTFLTKLMELGQGGEDAQYRASLVEKIRDGRLRVAEEESALREAREIVAGLAKDAERSGRALPAAKARPTAAEPAAAGLDFASVLLRGCRELNGLIADSDRLRLLLSENYQNPQTSLYRITVPVLAESSSLLTPRNAGLFLAGLVFLGLGLTLLACYVHDQSSKPAP